MEKKRADREARKEAEQAEQREKVANRMKAEKEEVSQVKSVVFSFVLFLPETLIRTSIIDTMDRFVSGRNKLPLMHCVQGGGRTALRPTSTEHGSGR